MKRRTKVVVGAAVIGLAAVTRPGVGGLPDGPVAVVAGPVLPRADLTPGKVADPASLSGTKDKLCAPGFTTKSVRPSSSVTDRIKVERLVAYGIPGAQIRGYELDHLVSLTVGGDPASDLNLWPEPWEHDGAHPEGTAAAGTGAQTKDKVENWLHRELCSGAMTLADVQHGEATNWAQYLQPSTGVTPATDG